MSREYYTGIRERIIQAKESEFGEGSSDFMNNARLFGLDIEIEPNNWSRGWTEILNRGDDSMQIYDKVVGVKNYPFSVNFKTTDWEFLKYIFDVELLEESDGVYTYKLKISPKVTSYELEWVKFHTQNPMIIQLLGAFVKSVSLTYSAGGIDEGGFVNASLDCNAKSHNLLESKTEVSLEDGLSPYRFFQSRLVLDSDEIVELNEGELNFERNINEEDSRYASKEAGREIYDPIPKIHRFNGRHNVNLKDTSLIKKWQEDEPLTGNNYIEFIKVEDEEEIAFKYEKIWINNAVPSTQRNDRTNVDIVWDGRLDEIIVKTKTQWDI